MTSKELSDIAYTLRNMQNSLQQIALILKKISDNLTRKE